MEEMIEMGTISSRGQVAIPTDMRREMGLEEGGRILFFLDADTLLIKKVTAKTFAEITKPLKEAAHKAGMKEASVPEMVERFRRKR